MTNYSKYELDARIATFMDRKMHQFPELKSERYYIERVDSVKPVEKHRTTIRSQTLPTRVRYALVG